MPIFPIPKVSDYGSIRTPDFNPNASYPEGFGGAPPREPLFKAPKLQFSTPKPEDEDEISQYMNQFKPDTRASDKFMNLMENVPERNKPGWGRRIAAGIVTAGKGSEAGEDVLYSPYKRSMADFKVRADLLKDLASAERSGNVNERMMLQSLLRQDVAERQQKTREAAQAERERSNRAREDINRVMSRMREIREDKTLSDEQKLALQNKYASDIERLRGDVRAGLIGEQAELDQILERLRQEGRISLEEKRETGRETLEEKKAEVAGGKAELPTQTKVRQYNIAREIFNTDPEAKKFLKIGAPGTNDFTITPRNVFLSSYRPEAQAAAAKKYDEIANKIYGRKADTTAPTSSTTTRTPKTAADVLPPGQGGTPKPDNTKVMKMKVRGTTKAGKITDYEVTSTDGGKTWKLPDGRMLEGAPKAP